MRLPGGHPHRLHQRRERDDDGFTVIECVLAITLFVAVLLPSAAFLTSSVRLSGDTKNRITATFLANQAVDGLRSKALTDKTFVTDYVNQPQSATTQMVPAVGGVTFTTQTLVDLQRSSGAGGSNCPATNASIQSEIIEITAAVTWPHMGINTPIRSTTDFAPPPGTFQATSGALSLQVDNAAGQPESGVTVAVAGAASTTTTTGPTGCAYFPNLAAGGPYTLTATASGEQTPTGQSSVGYTNVYVTSGTITGNNPVILDTPGTIQVSGLTVPNGSVSPAGLVYSVHSSGYSTTNSESAFPAAGNTSTPPADQVFPFSGSPFSVYVGVCSDDDPQGVSTSGGSFYSATNTPGNAPPASALQNLSVSPGGTFATSVPLYPMTLALTGSQTVIGADTLSVANTTTASVVWPAAEENWTCPAPLPAAATVTSLQGSQTVAMPLGHYTLTVTNNGTHLSSAPVYVWVQPTGVYTISTNGVISSTPRTVTLAAT